MITMMQKNIIRYQEYQEYHESHEPGKWLKMPTVTGENFKISLSQFVQK